MSHDPFNGLRKFPLGSGKTGKSHSLPALEQAMAGKVSRLPISIRIVPAAMGKDPKRIEPLVPVDLVVDHSVQVDPSRQKGALDLNMKLEFQRRKRIAVDACLAGEAYHQPATTNPRNANTLAELVDMLPKSGEVSRSITLRRCCIGAWVSGSRPGSKACCLH